MGTYNLRVFQCLWHELQYLTFWFKKCTQFNLRPGTILIYLAIATSANSICTRTVRLRQMGKLLELTVCLVRPKLGNYQVILSRCSGQVRVRTQLYLCIVNCKHVNIAKLAISSGEICESVSKMYLVVCLFGSYTLVQEKLNEVSFPNNARV